MRLEYKILWFEDEKKWLDSAIPFVEDFLDENGFILVYDHYPDDSNLNGILMNFDYDLILMDYSLHGTRGDNLIESIRNNSIYTEVLFYSQSGEQAVRNSIKDKKVDGVYCASRDMEEFEDKLKKVVNTTIKKVQDLNNVRGLVMAHASELDYKMIDIISSFLIKYEHSYKCDLEDYIYDITFRSIDDNAKKCEKLKSNNDVLKLINQPVFDTDKKRRTISKLLELLNSKDIMKCHTCMECYEDEVQKIRNILAHVNEEIDENGQRILKSKVKGYEDVKLNEVKYIEIRKNIIKHADNLDEIRNYIDGFNNYKDEVAAIK